MTFPAITFKHTNVEPNYTLQELVTSKLEGLEKYLGKSSARCHVEFEKMVAHQHGPICRIEVNLGRGSTLFRAEATEESFEKAIDEVRRNLEQELERAHDKRINVFRRSARRMKEALRFG
jgi:ribosomal subunit interface protein